MGNNDFITNLVFLTGLALVSTIAYIAFGQRRFGKAAFFFIFGLTILRTLVQRWLAGITGSNLGPNNQLADFLKDNKTIAVLYGILFLALIWLAVEDVNEYIEKRKLKRLAVVQSKTIDDKNLEIEELKTSIENEHDKES